jgi:NAD(P)-dependent dehydrogenase (short-subunit alcohol dehydrogenase family)
MTTFEDRDVGDLTGQTVIVTGATGGVGLATARAFAAAGAHVVLAVRNVAKGRTVAAGVPGNTEVRQLDLASLGSVRAFAQAWTRPISLLVNNAGAAPPPARTLTEDGFELQFGTNHLGHFALTNLLLGHVTGRVVTLASLAERRGRLDLDDLTWAKRPYRRSLAYNTSKLANLLFTAELQRRLDAAGVKVRAEAAHPGFVATDIYREGGPAGKIMVRLLAQDASQGARPVLFAAAADIPGGSFAGPSHLAHMRGAPELIGRSARARDAGLARRLWTVSEDLTGVTWPLGPGQRPG